MESWAYATTPIPVLAFLPPVLATKTNRPPLGGGCPPGPGTIVLRSAASSPGVACMSVSTKPASMSRLACCMTGSGASATLVVDWPCAWGNGRSSPLVDVVVTGVGGLCHGCSLGSPGHLVRWMAHQGNDGIRRHRQTLQNNERYTYIGRWLQPILAKTITSKPTTGSATTEMFF